MIEQSNEIARRINRQAGYELLPEAAALIGATGGFYLAKLASPAGRRSALAECREAAATARRR